MEETRQAYDQWAEQFDTNVNRTRDLEAVALRKPLAKITAERCLEIGCGTGKNTAWFVEHCADVTAVDFSSEMLARAEEKFALDRFRFMQADITELWNFVDGPSDLISFSLVLEHISDLDGILSKAAGCLRHGGHVYTGELHPFKQYRGMKARFDTGHGTRVVPCFVHYISDFTQAASRAGMQVLELNKYFDADDRSTVPRMLALLLTRI